MEKRHKILEIEEMQTYYGDSHVIQGLSMHVYEQEAVSIIGRNGAGKTTTLRSIMGLTPPRSGNIVIDTRGEIVNNLTTRQLEENPEIVQSHLSI